MLKDKLKQVSNQLDIALTRIESKTVNGVLYENGTEKLVDMIKGKDSKLTFSSIDQRNTEFAKGSSSREERILEFEREAEFEREHWRVQ